MSGATTPVNILLHGFFFMRLNPLNNNLEVLAPVLPDHHFVGGTRGSRVELTDKLIDRTDLTGKQGDPDPTKDIPGSVFQFPRSDTDITRFTGNLSKFKSTIVLPWPQAFYSLRTDDIAKSFPYVRTSKVGASIESNASGKGSSKLGAITLLQYTQPGAGALQNYHYYNQPCKPEVINTVNADFKEAAKCFQPDDTAFDLKLRTDVTIIPVDPNGYEERSLYEDPVPDVLLICPRSPNSKVHANNGSDTDPGTSPANCPTIFVG
jgi:hypothetical protein